MDIAGRPFLGHVLDRVAAARSIHATVVATTVEPADDAIEHFVRAQGAEVYRGSVHDVLDRFQQAATRARADIVVRVTADDPFKDPGVIDDIVSRLLADPELDYASNTLEPSYPDGLDIEVFRARALARAWTEARLPSEREHVTPYIWKQPRLFRLLGVRYPRDLSHLRWTLDYEEDLRFTREVYARLYRGRVFGMDEILALLEREPDLTRINTGIQRNSAYFADVAREQQPPPP